MLKPQGQSDSSNRGYEIYALVDPRDNLVYYVGLSVDAENRLNGHLTGSGDSLQARKWFLELRKAGLVPILRILEKIEPSSKAQTLACEKELYWIRELARQSQPLLNVLGLTRPYMPAAPLRQKTKKEVVAIEEGTASTEINATSVMDKGSHYREHSKTLSRMPKRPYGTAASPGMKPRLYSVSHRSSMPSLQQLLDETAITVSELSRRANVDYRTARKAVEGTGPIQRVKVLALLRVINELLGTTYKPEDIDGLETD